MKQFHSEGNKYDKENNYGKEKSSDKGDQNKADSHIHSNGFNNTLSQSLIRDVSFKVWQVAPADIEYQFDAGHTLSLYLNGGEHTFRHDKPDLKGHTGKLCLMPQGHVSRWHSPAPIQIAHLYLPDELIRQEAERHLDIDARLANLQDLIYQDDENLKQAMLGLIGALTHRKKTDPLFCEEALYSVTSRLLECYRQDGQTSNKKSRGLSASHRVLIKHHIHQHLEQKLTLESLAELVHLSPFHFARMFKQSFGDSPANYIIRQRIERAKALLKSDQPLSQLAVQCGFSHQSHLSNYFKKQTGVTPANYRALLG